MRIHREAVSDFEGLTMEKYVKINDVIDQLANEFGCVDTVTRGMLYALPDADVEPVRPELRKAVGLRRKTTI